MKNHKQFLGVIILFIIITPSITLASWWNPLSWFENNDVMEVSELIASPISNVEQKTKTKFNWLNPKSWIKRENKLNKEKVIYQENLSTTTEDSIIIIDTEKTELEIETEKAKAEAKKYKLEAEQTRLEVERLKKESEIKTQNQIKTETIQEENKNTTLTLPNGAIIEIDENGNIIRTIKEAIQKPSEIPQTTQQTKQETPIKSLEIFLIKISPNISSAVIEWKTNLPTTGKLFITGKNLSSKMFDSQFGLSTKHKVSISNLISNTLYSYEIESINNNKVKKESGSFTTMKQPIREIDLKLYWNSTNSSGFADDCKNPIVASAVKETKRAISTNRIIDFGEELGLGWVSNRGTYYVFDNNEYDIKSITFHNKGTQSLKDLYPQLKTSDQSGGRHKYKYTKPTYLDDNTIKFNDITLIGTKSIHPMLVINPKSWQTGKELNIEVSDIQLLSNNTLIKPIITELPLTESHPPTEIIKCEM
ncbi:MAG: hypothetical protein KAR54_02345 [Candidatus Pacebacteria bacterium]|nr:hypothetical protein [Candidatus Paceibacterota bacterium]